MPASTFTTELLSERVVIGLFDPSGIVLDALEQHSKRYGFEVHNLSVEDLEDTALLDSFFKVVVFLTPSSCTPQVQTSLKLLDEYQERCVVWISVITTWLEEVVGEVPHLQSFYSAQERLIEFVNVTLSQAVLILGKDIILPPKAGGIFDVLLQKLPSNIAFVPAVELSPIGLFEFVAVASRCTLKPDRISILISGPPVPGRTAVEAVVQPYENYYYHQVSLQPVLGVRQQLTEFPLPVEVSRAAVAPAYLWYSRNLPSPHNWKNLLPPLPRNLLQEGLATLTQPAQEFYSTSPVVQSEQRLVPVRTEPSTETPEPTPVHQSSKTQEKPMEPEEFDLHDEIQRIFGQTRTEEKIERVKVLVTSEAKITKTSKKRTVAFYGGLAFTGAGLGVLFLILFFSLSFSAFKKQVLATATELSTQKEVSEAQWQQLRRYSTLVSAQARGYESVVSLPQFEEALQVLELSEALQQLSSSEQKIVESQKTAFRTIVTSDAKEADSSENLVTELVTAQETIDRVITLLGGNTLGEAGVDLELSGIEKKRSELKELLSVSQVLEPLWPTISGRAHERNYAVVFQNNQELRPTGGFVEAVATVTMSNGSLSAYTVESSYQFDDDLPGQVLAPEQVTRYLGEKQLFLRDSNWNPDFKESAEKLKFFVEKRSKKQIDGVIALDLYAIQNILKATGPLDLPEFNEVVTAENLFERMEAHPEVVLVNDEKNKDYRVVVISHLLEAILKTPPEKAPTLAAALRKSFASQSMLWYSSEVGEQQSLQTLGWTGTVLFPHCPAEFASGHCLLDSVYAVEANVGVNKANYYLERSVDHQVEVAAEQLKHTVTTNYRNTASSNAWPKGAYKNYVRFYIPQSAQSVLVKIGDTVVEGKLLDTAREYERQMVGVLLEVPYQSSQKLELQYTLPFSASHDVLNYAMLRQQQPGLGAHPVSFTLKYDSSYSPTLITPQAVATPGLITFSDITASTKLFAVQFNSAK